MIVAKGKGRTRLVPGPEPGKGAVLGLRRPEWPWAGRSLIPESSSGKWISEDLTFRVVVKIRNMISKLWSSVRAHRWQL